MNLKIFRYTVVAVNDEIYVEKIVKKNINTDILLAKPFDKI